MTVHDTEGRTRSSVHATAGDKDRSLASAGREDTDISGSVPGARWHRRFAQHLLVTDVLVLFGAAVLSAIIRFGVESSVRTVGPVSLSYWSFGALLAVGWSLSLVAYRTRDDRILGDGVEEYRRIVRASVTFFGLVAIISLIVKFDSSRGYLAIMFPLGLAGLLVTRRAWRFHLHRRREEGEYTNRALVIGGTRSAEDIVRQLHRDARPGVRVAGVWVPDSDTADDTWIHVPGTSVPVMGTERDLQSALRATEAELVIVTDSEHLGHAGLKELTWELESLDVDLLLSPNVVDVSGSRIQLSSIGRLPLLSIQKPTYGDASTWPKKAFDRVGATFLLVAALPLLAMIAVLIKTTSAGPVFYRQQRIGRDGQPFHMLKFRTMSRDADDRLQGLLEDQGRSLEPLAKLEIDPRITPVGRFLRRYSLDEIPQLLNVILGSMSLVGPRPQRQFEVDMYDDVAHRRLRVLPGMTGLWQVSGRSDLSWEDAVRLDIHYVENWSLTADILILWRTVLAVLRGQGAR